MGKESRAKQEYKKRRIILIETCVTCCPFYDVDAEQCSKLRRAVRPWDGIDKECPLPKEHQ